MCRTYLKFLLTLDLILVQNVVLTEDGKLTVHCYNMNILISIEMSANTVIFTVSAHIIFIVYCFLKFPVFSVNHPHSSLLDCN